VTECHGGDSVTRGHLTQPTPKSRDAGAEKAAGQQRRVCRGVEKPAAEEPSRQRFVPWVVRHAGWSCGRDFQSVAKTGRYCWSTLFKVLEVRFLGTVSSAFLPSKKASWTLKFRPLEVGQQYPSIFLISTVVDTLHMYSRRRPELCAVSLDTLSPGSTKCNHLKQTVCPLVSLQPLVWGVYRRCLVLARVLPPFSSGGHIHPMDQ
jgi:hypothetical protein